MARFRVKWESGEEEITAQDKGSAMEDALDMVLMEAEEIDDDDDDEEEEEEEDAEEK